MSHEEFMVWAVFVCVVLMSLSGSRPGPGDL